MQNETSIVKACLVQLSAIPGVRVWRQNTGVAYGPGEFRRVLSGLPARPVRFGVPGQADITGLGPAGRRIEVECKTERGRQTEEQRRFESMVRSLGGIYVVARSGEEAVRLVREALAA